MLEKGYNFTIIGGALDYMSGKLYPDFKGFLQEKELIPGKIKLIRTYVTPTYRKGFIGKMLTYISFLISSVIASLRTGKFDMLLTTSPSLLTALAGYIVSKIKGIPFILEIRDLWPKVAMEMGMVKNKFIIWIAEELELFLYRKAVRIIVITEGYADYIKSRGISPSKINIVYNGVDECMLDYKPSDEIPEDLKVAEGKFTVMYAGAIGKFNYLEDLLKAVELIEEQEKFAFVFIGDGGERKNLINYAKEKNLNNIFFLGAKQRSEIPEYLSKADLTVAIYPPIPTGKLLLQNKVLDFLSLGKAVILAAEEGGDTVRIILSAACGIRVNKSPEAIAEKLVWASKNKELCEEMGKKGREYARVHLNRKKLACEMINIFEAERI